MCLGSVLYWRQPKKGGGGLQKLTEVDKGEGEGSPKVDVNYDNFVNLISFGLRKVKKGDKLWFSIHFYYT